MSFMIGQFVIHSFIDVSSAEQCSVCDRAQRTVYPSVAHTSLTKCRAGSGAVLLLSLCVCDRVQH